MTTRSPSETVRVYLDELYAQGRVEMAPELIADPTWRHEKGQLSRLSVAETQARLRENFTRWPKMRFDSMVTIAENDKVAVIWNGYCTKPDGEVQHLNGIEVFRVRDGKIVEIWNSEFAPTLWQTSPLGP